MINIVLTVSHAGHWSGLKVPVLPKTPDWGDSGGSVRGDAAQPPLRSPGFQSAAPLHSDQIRTVITLLRSH